MSDYVQALTDASQPTPRKRRVAGLFGLRRRRPDESDYELIFGGIGLATLIAAWTWPIWRGLYPGVCPLKTATDLPCVTCGGTRAFHAWTHLHFVEALQMNPLAMALAVGLTLYVPFALTASTLGLAWRPQWLRFESPAGRRRRLTLFALTVAVLLCNWAYLIAVGR